MPENNITEVLSTDKVKEEYGGVDPTEAIAAFANNLIAGTLGQQFNKRNETEIKVYNTALLALRDAVNVMSSQWNDWLDSQTDIGNFTNLERTRQRRAVEDKPAPTTVPTLAELMAKKSK